jgi:hypothetical protein
LKTKRPLLIKTLRLSICEKASPLLQMWPSALHVDSMRTK